MYINSNKSEGEFVLLVVGFVLTDLVELKQWQHVTCHLIIFTGSGSRDAKRGAKGAHSPGTQDLDGSFRYQNGYYLSVM